jgi:hypothetical protein
MIEPMNAWNVALVDVEDMRRRCPAHANWMADHPEAAAFSERWADQNLEEIVRLKNPVGESIRAAVANRHRAQADSTKTGSPKSLASPGGALITGSVGAEY